MADKNYVGYVKREADSFIDWASIGKNLSDTLIDIRDDRDKQKAEIQQQTDELVKSINEAELGQNSTFNQKVLDGAAQSQQALLAAYKEFTSGRLKQPAYARFKQVLRDDWSQYNNAIKTYNQKYDEALKKVKDGTMAGWGEVAFQKDSDFLNYQKYNIFVNPTSGRLALAEVDQDGNIITDPSKMLSVNNITNIYSDQPEKFKIDAFTDKVVDKAKEFTKVRGNISIKDATASDEYKAYEKAEIDAIIENSPRDVASILTDFSGEKYDVIFDSKVYDGLSQSEKDRTILLERDGSNRYQPKMSDALKAKAEEVLKTRIRGKVDYVEKTDYKPDAERKESSTERSQRTTNETAFGTVYKILTGTKDRTIVNNQIFGTSKFTFDPATSTVTYLDINGNPKTVSPFKNEAGETLDAVEATIEVLKSYGITDEAALRKIAQKYAPVALTGETIEITSAKPTVDFRKSKSELPSLGGTSTKVSGRTSTVLDDIQSDITSTAGSKRYDYAGTKKANNQAYVDEYQKVLNNSLANFDRNNFRVVIKDNTPYTSEGNIRKVKRDQSPLKSTIVVMYNNTEYPLKDLDIFTSSSTDVLNAIENKISELETNVQPTTELDYGNL